MEASENEEFFKKLIPQLQAHWATDDIDQWIHIEGDFEHLVGCGRIFWPGFVEHDDCFFSLVASLKRITWRSWHRLMVTNLPSKP